MDKKKVTKGLNQHCNGSMFNRCDECPYYKFENASFVCRDELLEDVFTLLKEQEAVKPVEEFIKSINRHDYHCKRCGNIVGTIFDDKHPIFPGAKLSIKHFCDVCGQAVKWNE